MACRGLRLLRPLANPLPMSAAPRADAASAILNNLETVAHERQRRAADAALDARVSALKTYQQARFRHSYADLLASPRYGAAARFFLDELYGPHDFSRRDAQFARIVPALIRLFPGEIVRTVASLAALHGLSESLDSAMAEALADSFIDASDYACAWQSVGRFTDRSKQLALMLDVGRSLDDYARKPMLSVSLHMMRGPARAAGLSELQEFLELGFGTFKAMRGAAEFLATIERREQALLKLLEGPQEQIAGTRQLP